MTPGLMDIKSSNVEPCDFQCHEDVICIPSWRICDGHFDCHDHSDESECPQTAALIQAPPNPVAKPYADIMQEISGLQICIVAVALVLTLLLITCVINHYKQLGVRSWNSNHRKQKTSKRSTAPSVLYSPAKVEEQFRRDTAQRQEQQLMMLSVHRDLELNLPVQVSRPLAENYCERVQLKPDQMPKAYVRPPPNRTVTMKDRCVIPKVAPNQVHGQKSFKSKETGLPVLVTRPPPLHNPQSHLDYAPERWQPPGSDSCVLELFVEPKNLATTHDPPKYEKMVNYALGSNYK